MKVASLAHTMANNDTPDEFQQRLTSFNRWRFAPEADARDWESRLATEYWFRVMEGDFVERERAQVKALAAQVPSDPDAFVDWFEALKATGPGQGDALFPWLAERATLAEMKWFLQQEVAGEAGFDDLVALTQVRLPAVAKLELARNYWDEMGRGQPRAMHGPMLQRLAAAFALQEHADVVWESLALGNMMCALAANRHYTYQSIGALGVIELTAPGRAELVNEGLKRLGVDGEARQYFALHATLDVRHSEAWNREVLRPLVAEAPRLAEPIAEGALLRLNAGARCFVRYRRELDVALGRAAGLTSSAPESGPRVSLRKLPAPRVGLRS